MIYIRFSDYNKCIIFIQRRSLQNIEHYVSTVWLTRCQILPQSSGYKYLQGVTIMNRSHIKYISGLLLFGLNGIVSAKINLSSYEIVFFRTLFGGMFLLLLYLWIKRNNQKSISEASVSVRSDQNNQQPVSETSDSVLNTTMHTSPSDLRNIDNNKSLRKEHLYILLSGISMGLSWNIPETISLFYRCVCRNPSCLPARWFIRGSLGRCIWAVLRICFCFSSCPYGHLHDESTSYHRTEKLHAAIGHQLLYSRCISAI